MSIETLKEQARRHEQKEEWRKALDQYRKAIARLERDDQPDIGLYNRVGDLYVRVSDLVGAVEHYEKAVDLYVEAGLHNNAIAVCKKIIRNIPLRSEVYLKMGQIRAEQGFLSDARTSFLTYAERMQQAGELEESFRALIEFCDLAPDEVDLRTAVAEQLAAHDRTSEAVTQLVLAYHRLVAGDAGERADQVRGRILELDPDADLTPPSDEAILEPGAAFDGGLTADDVPPPAGATLDGFETTALSEAPSATGGDGVAEEVPGAPSPGDDSTGVAEADDEAVVAVEIALEDEVGPDDEVGDLRGVLDAEEADEPEEEGADLEAVEDPAAALAEAAAAFADEERAAAEEDEAPAPVAEDDEPDEEDAEPLPLISFEDDEELEEVGAGVEAAELPSLIEASPDDLSLRQRALELAYQDGEGEAIVAAFLGLAGALSRSGETARATATYRHVLELDPGNAEAASALGDGMEPVERPVQEVAAHDDYVDLGSLLLGGEKQKSTRFVVAYEEPSGDEDADFAKMLSQFKEKVSENLDAGDVRAHHDLGTAYKEMGLLDEAVAEFQQALRGSAKHLPTYELLGQTFMEMGNAAAAVRTLERALEVDHEVEDELLGIYYHLGRAYQEVGNRASALEFYDRVFALDINFADVTERLRSLR